MKLPRLSWIQKVDLAQRLLLLSVITVLMVIQHRQRTTIDRLETIITDASVQIRECRDNSELIKL